MSQSDDFDRDPRASLAGARRAEELQDLVEDSVQSAPWYLISLAAHALFFLVLTFIPIAETVQLRERTAIIDVVPQTLPQMKEPVREVPDANHPIKEKEDPTDEPVIREAPEADHNETDNNEVHEQARGEEDEISDKVFRGKGILDNLGLGSNGAGTFGARLGGKEDLLKSGGGGRGTEEAVRGGLRWLADHQNPDGSWDSDGFEERCRALGHTPCGGAASFQWTDPGNTGLALLAFLGAGNTHRTGEYKDTVKRAVVYLKSVQDPEGCFGARVHHYMYNHSIAALAMAEAYALSARSPLLKTPAQSGIDFLAAAQNPGLAWRYTKQCGENDTSVTGWCVMALKSARAAGLQVPRECFEGPRRWLEKVTDENYGKVGYRSKGDPGARLQDVADRFQPSESMTAVGMTTRLFLGARPSDPALLKGAALLVDNLPEWSEERGTIDMYYWYYGTLAMFQMGGQAWDRWNAAMKSALVDTQRKEGGQAGSWDAVGAWGNSGGRVYATAVNVLSLEIYYRYGKLLQ